MYIVLCKRSNDEVEIISSELVAYDAVDAAYKYCTEFEGYSYTSDSYSVVGYKIINDRVYEVGIKKLSGYEKK